MAVWTFLLLWFQTADQRFLLPPSEYFHSVVSAHLLQVYTHLPQVSSGPCDRSEVSLITAPQTSKHKQLMRDPLAGCLCCVNTAGTSRAEKPAPYTKPP